MQTIFLPIVSLALQAPVSCYRMLHNGLMVTRQWLYHRHYLPEKQCQRVHKAAVIGATEQGNEHPREVN